MTRPRFELILALALCLPVAAAAQTAIPSPAEAATPQPPLATPPAGGLAAPAAPAPAATVEAAVIAEILAQVPVSGTLVAEREVQVHSQVSGFEIVEIAAEAGDRVEKGQLLARLSDATLAAQLQQAEAEHLRAEASLSQARSQVASTEAALTQAAASLERVQRLRQSGSASQAALDQTVAEEAAARAAAASSRDGIAVAQAAVAQAAAARDIARLNLEHARIVAPVAGVVAERNAELGSMATAGGGPLFTLVAGGRVELAGEVIETALGEISVGDPAQIRVAGVGDVAGKVRLIPASVDPATRLGIVRIALDEPERLRPGLFAAGTITTERREAVTVPSTAVIADAGAEVVQVVRDGRVEARPVQAGHLWEGRRGIVAGLEAGEMVITRAGEFFRDGDPVTPVRAGAAP